MSIRTALLVVGTAMPVVAFTPAAHADDPVTTVATVETEMNAATEAMLAPPAPTVSGPGSAIAPPNTTPPADDSKKDAARRIHATLGIDTTTTYMSRGILSKDKGVIVQPYALVGVDLWTADNASLSTDVGVWSSFHGDTTGAAATAEGIQENWFECDWTFGINYKRDNWGVRVAFNAMTSPSDSFKSINEVQLAFSLDDSSWMGKWAMNPTILFVKELGRNGSDGAGLGKGSYLEIGLTPGFDWERDNNWKARVNFPCLVGISLDDFYQNAANKEQTFGFAETGCRLLIPMNFPGEYGNWTLNTGVRFVFLGEAAKQFNTNKDGFEVIGNLGMSVSF